jgi:tagaturonate epimerase
MILAKYSMGVGDRFAHQGRAQLAAFAKAKQLGVEVAPVWNKSNREHQIIGTQPIDVRREADEAVAAAHWCGPYHVDADHIGLKTVDSFIEASDYFTLDVADFTGKPAAAEAIGAFTREYRSFVGMVQIPGIDEPFRVTDATIEAIAQKYLLAVKEAGRIYRHVAAKKGDGGLVAEVSMDETDLPQTPAELLFILAAIAEEGIPAQTIAPKFTGRFNKGVDYVGDLVQFEKEFNEDLCVIAFAVREFGLPANLKLSVHSGSDKFSLYPLIHRAIMRHGAGLHLKTAGTTWLEEIIGLAMAGGDGLQIARKVYREAFGRFDELCAPYATVIDIDRGKLPSPDEVDQWSESQFADALRHDLACPSYNLHVRQLLHVGYKVAAEMGASYLDALVRHEKVIAGNVSANIFERHLKPVFIG